MQARAVRRRSAMFVVACACLAVTGRADDALEWLDVTPDAPVDHTVMIRGPFHEAHEKVSLTGPVALVAAGHGADAGPCFTVYAVAATGAEPVRTVRAGPHDAAFRLGPPAFLLVPAQRLTDGAPADSPRVVYELRPILDPPAAIEAQPATAGPPTHLGLPVDYRHHFDRLPVADPGRGLVILDSRPVESTAAAVQVVDDFGLKRLEPGGRSRAAAWFTVRAPAPR